MAAAKREMAIIGGADDVDSDIELAKISAEGAKARKDGEPMKANPYLAPAMDDFAGLFRLEGKVDAKTLGRLWVKSQEVFAALGLEAVFRRRFPEPHAWMLGWQREHGHRISRENQRRKTPDDPKAGGAVDADLGTAARRRHGAVHVETIDRSVLPARAKVAVPTALDAMRPHLDPRQFWAGRMVQELHMASHPSGSVYGDRVTGRGDVSDAATEADALLRGALAVAQTRMDGSAVAVVCCDNKPPKTASVPGLVAGLDAIAEHFAALQQGGDEKWARFLDRQKKLDDES